MTGRRSTPHTALTADTRVKHLRHHGHTLDVTSDRKKATVTIHRTDGATHTVTITEDDIPAITRAGLPYRLRSQATLIVKALHAACDWNDERDKETAEPVNQCQKCGTAVNLFPEYHAVSKTTVWWCRSCYLVRD